MPDPATHAASTDPPGLRALACDYAARGREDEAAAVRVFWREIRAGFGGPSIDATLVDVRDNADILGRLARQVGGRGRG